MARFIFNGNVTNPASVAVEADTVEEAKAQLEACEFDVCTQHTHHIVEFVWDGAEPERRVP